jgi:hypothetical protein
MEQEVAELVVKVKLVALRWGEALEEEGALEQNRYLMLQI